MNLRLVVKELIYKVRSCEMTREHKVLWIVFSVEFFEIAVILQVHLKRRICGEEGLLLRQSIPPYLFIHWHIMDIHGHLFM